MKRILAALILASSAVTAGAQTDDTAKEIQALAKDSRVAAEADSAKPWKFAGMLSLTATQTGLKNWAAGGDQQVGLNALASLSANYAKGKHSWQNSLLCQYGMLRVEKEDFRKTDDKLQIASKYGYAISKKWYYSTIFDYKSQFSNGYQYNDDDDTKTLTSAWWSPLYLTYTLGFDFQPSDKFTLYISPICGKSTIVSDDELAAQGAFGVDPGKNSRSEFGWYMRASFSRNITEYANMSTNLTLFSNYRDGFVDEVDVDWNFILTFQINKWLALNFTSELIYDEDITIKEKDSEAEHCSLVQFKEVLGAGLTFKF